MQHLIAGAQEQPFSSWKNFVEPLKNSEADRAARLVVIHQQQAELDEIRQQVAASEADRAARLVVIHQQQAEIAKLKTFKGFFGYRVANLRAT